jgi:hypothetical protein
LPIPSQLLVSLSCNRVGHGIPACAADKRDDFVRIMLEYQTGAAQPATGATTTAERVPVGGVTAGDEMASFVASARAGADPFAGLLTGMMGGDTGEAGGFGVGDLFEVVTKGGLRAPTTPGQKPTEADFHELLKSPLGRAVLGEVAGFGMQELEVDEPGSPRGTGF